MFERVAVYGVGLLGGSLGLACRDRGLAGEVVGVGRNEGRLTRAVELGAVDRFTTDPAEGFGRADLVVLCAPVNVIVDMLPVVREASPPGALVTDVGSSKGTIARAARGVFARSDSDFVGSHPMAGSERTGVANSSADLYEGAPCYLTPTDGTAERAVDRLRRFWGALGCRVVTMSAEQHDRTVAWLSHLPHAAAVAVILALGRSGLDQDDMKRLAGPGLLDTTRVAAGSPEMWRDIFQDNRDAVLETIDGFSRGLDDLRATIESGEGEALIARLEEARRLRQNLPKAGQAGE